MIMYYHTKFGNKRTSSSEDTVKTHILIIRALAVTLTLKIANQSFCMSLKFMMMHQNTKFGNKMLGGFEGIIWINIDNLTICCDLDLECSNSVFHETVWLIMMYHQTKFGGGGGFFLVCEDCGRMFDHSFFFLVCVFLGGD